MNYLVIGEVLAILRLDGYERFVLPRWMIPVTVLVLLSTITLWRLISLVFRWWTRPVKSPHRLFRALCDRHQLSASEREMLQKMAADSMHDPNYLFIDPDLWNLKSLAADSESLKRALFQRLFGDLPAQS